MPVVDYYFLEESGSLVWVPSGGGDPLPVIDTDPEQPEVPGEDPGAATAELRYSYAQDYTGNAPLDGAVTDGPVAIYLTEAGVQSVDFYYTPPGGSEVFERTENTPPLAFKGDINSQGTLFDPPDGVNKIRAHVTWEDGSRLPSDVVAQWSHEKQQVPADPELTAPVLSVAGNGDRYVDLAWTDIAGETGFRVFEDGIQVGEVAAGVLTFRAGGLVNGVVYSFTVAGFTAVGVGPASNAVTGTPVGPAPAPGDRFEPSGSNVGAGTGGHTSTLTRVNGFNASVQGKVYRDLDISGSVAVLASDVRFINCKFRGSGGSGVVYAPEGPKNAVFERCTIEAYWGGSFKNGKKMLPLGGIVTRHYTEARFCKVTGITDCVKAWHYSIYESCYMRSWKEPDTEKHVDVIQGSGKTDWTARGNTLVCLHGEGGNFPLFNQSFTGSHDTHVYNVLWEYNWLNGGNKHVALGDGKPTSSGGSGHGGWLHNTVIRHNRHGLDCRYASIAMLEGDVRTDSNVWDVSGTTTFGKSVTAGTLAYGS